MNGNKIIVHTLITLDGKYLVTKRAKEETTFPEYWDIPGGLADYGELPKEAVIRETKDDDIKNIKLQLEEHSEYKLINSLKELDGEKISPFLIELFNNDLELVWYSKLEIFFVMR